VGCEMRFIKRHAVWVIVLVLLSCLSVSAGAKVKPKQILQAISAAHRLERAGAIDEAMNIYANLARSNPQNRVVLDAYLNALARTGRSAEATEFFEKLSVRFPEFWFYPLALGRLYAEIGDTARARSNWEKALLARPNDPNFYRELGSAERTAGMCEMAKKAYLLGRQVTGRPELYGLEMVETLEECGETEQAITEALSSLKGNPGIFDWVRAYLKKTVSRSPDLRKTVLKKLKSYVSGDGDVEAGRLLLVDLLAESGKTKEGKRQLRSYGKSQGDLQRLYLFGKELRSLGRLDLAEAALKRFAEGSKPSRDVLQAHMILGEMAEQRGAYAEARSQYGKVYELAPAAAEAVTAQLRLAALERNVERNWEGARRIYERLLSGSKLARNRTDISLELGDCYVAMGDFDRAVATFSGIARRGGVAEVVGGAGFRLAEALFYRGQIDSARSAFLKVAESFPSRGYGNDALEKVLLIDESESPERLAEYARAEWLDFAGKPDSALSLLSAIRVGSEDEVLLGYACLKEAEILNRLGRSSESVAVLGSYLDDHRESHLAPRLQKALGDTFAEYLQDDQRAQRTYEDLLVRYPDSAVAVEVRKVLEEMRSLP